MQYLYTLYIAFYGSKPSTTYVEYAHVNGYWNITGYMPYTAIYNTYNGFVAPLDFRFNKTADMPIKQIVLRTLGRTFPDGTIVTLNGVRKGNV